jgi:hypothetical protein
MSRPHVVRAHLGTPLLGLVLTVLFGCAAPPDDAGDVGTATGAAAAAAPTEHCPGGSERVGAFCEFSRVSNETKYRDGARYDDLGDECLEEARRSGGSGVRSDCHVQYDGDRSRCEAATMEERDAWTSYASGDDDARCSVRMVIRVPVTRAKK